MNPKKFKPKRKRDRPNEALVRLRQRWERENPGEEWEAHAEPEVTPMLRAADGGIRRILEALRAHDDDDARAFLAELDACTPSDRKALRLEDLAYASGIGSLRLAELAQTALYLYASAQTKLLIASAMPKVTRSIVKAATDEVPITARNSETGDNEVVGKTNGDVKAMELFGKMSGIVPIPKGNQIAIQNNFGEREERKSEAATVNSWKYPEDRLKEIVAVVSPKQLPVPARGEDQIHFEQNRPMVFER